MNRVLIVDDDVAVTNYFMVFLMQTDRFDSTVVNDSREVESILKTQSFDVIMLDLDMPNVSGIDILNMMQAKEISIPVVVLTGANDVDLAVRSMKRGAFDYLTKPVDDEHLIEVLDNAIEHGAVRETIDKLPAHIEHGELRHSETFTHLPTTNPEMTLLLRNAEKVAKCDLSVFIWGEQGTGKERLAKAIHQSSLRAGGPFVAVDCTAHIQEEFSSELFGRAKDWGGKHDEKQGFVEAASEGTLFIDNVDCLGLPVQVRLKRVIQNSEYYRDNSTEIKRSDVRIIVASTRDLTSPGYRDSFSRDLLYHLMVNSMKIPPLRSRPEDIPLIAVHFLQQELKKLGQEVNSLSISDDLLELLVHYSYPDNVQELQNIIACAVVGTESDEITPEDLSPYIRERISPGDNTSDFTPAVLQEVIQDHISKTLKYCGENLEQAASLLGISVEEIRKHLTDH
ncbi:MAG: sigma-54-dependent Fis family transcriptional regulator [Candidatus Fermentibacteraceae bacterium]|nr:sigma-54-dependent Fis family transcriptional regulator [Candidatus Fermentibacteraceae bacterium]